MRKHPRSLAAVTAFAVLLVPTAATAAQKSVSAGPHKRPKSAPPAGDVNAFFPSKVKVAQGDTVAFAFNGFHNIAFRKAVPFVLSDSTKTISGVNDAAGKPFWFNGQARLVVNPRTLLPSGDGVINKSRNDDSSGLPEGEGAPKPYKVKFTRTGTFTYVCDIHPGMKGKVTVQKKGRKVPSRRSDAARADAQLAKAVKTLRRNDAYKGPGGSNVRVGNDTRDTALFKFFPSTLEVNAGEPVKFQMPGSTPEIHNVAVGPEAYIKQQSEGLIAPDMSSSPPAITINPIALFPSDPPTSFPAHNPGLHGNGFLNIGGLDTNPASPFPNQGSMTFNEGGTYTAVCIIHAPDMKMTIRVR